MMKQPDFTPFIPDIYTLLPENMFNNWSSKVGLRIGWKKGHVCPCTAQTGQVNTGCKTCYGRGYYWDSPPVDFFGNITFGHTSVMPEEPGVSVDKKFGVEYTGTPTITIPHMGNLNENAVWNNCGELDAFILYDDTARFNTAFINGVTPAILPYEIGLNILGVFVYNTDQSVSILPSSSYTLSNATVSLIDQPLGLKFVIEYTASSIYLAFRKAGGRVHSRPFGGSVYSGMSKRFHVVGIDWWLRSRFAGDGPNIITPNPPVNTSGTNLFQP